MIVTIKNSLAELKNNSYTTVPIFSLLSPPISPLSPTSLLSRQMAAHPESVEGFFLLGGGNVWALCELLGFSL